MTVTITKIETKVDGIEQPVNFSIEIKKDGWVRSFLLTKEQCSELVEALEKVI